ncbi:MAG: hypothetical protein KatS3mg132_692 [Limisphaera sp.]|nr:MAG: hypothetical protein KatS3mg132_692 [Limisphaera sp.]
MSGPCTGWVALVTVLVSLPRLPAQIPAFPGAEGFGAYAPGGRGGDVYYVTNLNSSGPGSFADAVATAPAAGRTIVFGVSGYIRINKFNLNKSRITIAGQTAPGDGIGFEYGPLIINGSDIVIRHVRFRYGQREAGGDCINLGNGVTNIMLDHLSVMFSTDENISSFSQNPRPDLVTFQWSLSAWGLESHSAGGLWDLNRVTTHHTLWAHNHTRNPKARPDGLLDWINNVTYDWDIGFIMGDSSTPADWKANVIGNYFICPPGNLRSVTLEKASLDRNGNHNFTLHVSNNLFDNNGNTVLDGTDRGFAIASGNYRASPSRIMVAGPQVPVAVDPPLTAWKKIVSQAGALRLDARAGIPLRDEVDTILIENLLSWRRMHVSHESQTGAGNNGWGRLNSAPAPTDTDRDGMPDDWELTLGWNPDLPDPNVPLPSSGGVLVEPTFFPPGTPAGYTRLEEYLHFKAIPHAIIPRSTPDNPTSLQVDLRRYTLGFSTPPVRFQFGQVIGGSVQLLPDGSTAVFSPHPGYTGRARFDFTVTDGDGSTWTQTFAILVSAARVPRDLRWQGDGVRNLWDTQTPNFRNSHSTTAFQDGDHVRFDDSGSNQPPVTLAEALRPGSVEVDASQNYTFTGPGSLHGTMSLVKRGPGELVLATTNSYTGGTLLAGGLLILSNTTLAAGIGPIQMEGGDLLLAAPGGPAVYNQPLEVRAPGTLRVPGSGNANQAWGAPVTGSATLYVHVATGGTFSARSGMDLSGYTGVITLTGPGWFRWQGGTGSSTAGFDLGPAGAMITRDGGTITLGALWGGPASSLGGASVSANPTTYLVGQRGSSTFEGTLRDGVAPTTLVKLGESELALTGTSLHTGGTRIGAGSLRIDGWHGPAPVIVSNNAALAGTGVIEGPITVLSGGRIEPGGPGVGTLTLAGGLALNSPVLEFDLGGSPDAPSDRIHLQGGLLTMNSLQTYRFRLLEGQLEAGTYTLIEGGDNTAAAGAVFTHNLPGGTRQRFVLQRPPAGDGQCYVRLVVEGNPATLLWRGFQNNVWDLTSSNWWNNGQPDRFYPLDTVLVDDTSAAVPELHLATAINAAAILVDISIDRTFTGPGSLVGAGTLTKSGPGTLRILNTNAAFQGAVHVSGGTLELAAAGTTLGQGPLVLSGGGTFRMPPTTAQYLHSGTITVPAGQSGTLYSPGLFNQILGPVVSGDTHSVLRITSGVSFGGTDSTQFDRFTGTIHVLPGATLRFAAASSGNTFGSLAPTFRVDGSLRPRNAGNTIRLGAVTGSGALEGPQSNAGSGDTLYIIGGNDTHTTFSGNISSNSAVPGSRVLVRKVGSGRLTLRGASTFTGGTTVEAGALLVNNTTGSGTGTGPVQVQSGATLGGTGTLAGPVTIEDHGRLAPGDGGPGTLTFLGDLELNEFSELEWDLGTASDQIIVEGSFTLAGRLHIVAGPGFGPGTYILARYNPARPVYNSGLEIADAPPRYQYTLESSPGEIRLVVSPPQHPRFTTLRTTPDTLSVAGEGGVPSAEYVVLTTTNLTLPLHQWTPITTNRFDPDGRFEWSQPLDTLVPGRFFILTVR